MKTIRKLAIALTLASSALSAAPLVTLQPESLFAESGKAFKIDVTLSFNSLAELGEIAELSAFGFNFSNSGNLVFSSMQLHSSYDDFSLFSNEVVGLAGLTGGSTASPVTIGQEFVAPIISPGCMMSGSTSPSANQPGNNPRSASAKSS